MDGKQDAIPLSNGAHNNQRKERGTVQPSPTAASKLQIVNKRHNFYASKQGWKIGIL